MAYRQSNAPRKIAGAHVSFADFSTNYDLGAKALRQGLSCAESGFGPHVVRHGDYMSAESMQPNVHVNRGVQQPGNSNNPFASDAQGSGKRRHAPDMPYPKNRQRDDLEAEFAARARPRPF